MKKSICITSIIFALVVGISSIASGKDSYLNQFNTRYGTTGTKLNSCTLCHSTTPALNSYGAAFKNNSHNFATIEPLDSDGDGFSNIVEINARTFPGNSSSKPSSPADKTPPTASLSIGAFSTPRKVGITLSATDDVGGSGVTGYMVKLSATTPGKSSPNWKAAPPTSFTFPLKSTSGPQTLYAWAKDRAGNISAPANVSVDLDVTKPTVTAFSAQAASPASGTVTISITAEDPLVNGVASGVTAYMVTKSNLTPPSPSSTKWVSGPPPPGSATFAATVKPGATLYAWAKDVSGNVSKPKSAKVTAPVGALAAKPAAAMAASATQTKATDQVTSTEPLTAADDDMSLWTGRWFKVDMTADGYDPTRSKLSGDRRTVAGYLKVWDWDPVNKILQSDLYLYDSQTDQWVVDALPLYGATGNALDFQCWSQVTGEVTYGFTARIRGEGSNGFLMSASFQTLGGYTIEENLESGAPQQLAGWLTLTGALVDASEVPVPSAIISN
jgi:hypothetical protein